MWKIPGFGATMAAVMAAFGAWSLLLPLLPLAVLESGGSSGLAGATTGVFMAATVGTQVFTPWMLRKWGYSPVMAASAFMLGAPALGHMLGMEAWQALLFSGLRGVGFGALTVAQAAFVAELVPLRFLGKATGALGVCIGLAQMVFLPLGLAISDIWSFDVAFIVACVFGVFGMVMCLPLPRLKPNAMVDDALEKAADAPKQVSMWKLVLVPALSVTTLSMTYGLVSSFLPAAVRSIDPGSGAVLGGIMLSIVGGFAMVSRYVAGVVADRSGKPDGLTIPAQFAGFFGVMFLAVGLYMGWSVWALAIGAGIFGAAFGVIQNEALLSMFARLPRHRVSEASAVWNIFYDAGTGLGSVVLAVLIIGENYAPAFAVGSLVILSGVLMTGLDSYLGAHRVAEYDNIKTRLKRLRKL
ncbi:membrane protein [Corynebacterium phocae]|uniref:Membrane protein n=1 Tax=Corynebacterium phocae TaxID=161895 RepID=A0A1L7D6D8_9CORY|nr:membrane protein [Corynebacterium phocae]